MLLAQVFVVDGEGCRPVPAFYLGDNQFTIVCTQNGCCLADGGRTHMLLNSLAWIRHFDLGELLSGVEYQFLA